MGINLWLEEVKLKPFVKKIRRVYHAQATKLVELCREAIETGKTSNWDALKSILSSAEEALKFATDTTFDETPEATKAFKNVKQRLYDYSQRSDVKDPSKRLLNNVHGKLDVALTEDREAMKRYCRLLSRRPRLVERSSGPKLTIDIYVGRKPLTDHHDIIPGEFQRGHTLVAVLWKLIQEKKVNLKENPHFYARLPSNPADYDDNFSKSPLPLVDDLETTTKRIKFSPVTPGEHLVLDVLTDRESRILVNCNNISKVFGNIWKPGITLFKDIGGTLKSAGLIEKELPMTALYLDRKGQRRGPIDWHSLFDTVKDDTEDLVLVSPQTQSPPPVALPAASSVMPIPLPPTAMAQHLLPGHSTPPHRSPLPIAQPSSLQHISPIPSSSASVTGQTMGSTALSSAAALSTASLPRETPSPTVAAQTSQVPPAPTTTPAPQSKRKWWQPFVDIFIP